jgi:hypothetical protein
VRSLSPRLLQNPTCQVSIHHRSTRHAGWSVVGSVHHCQARQHAHVRRDGARNPQAVQVPASTPPPAQPFSDGERHELAHAARGRASCVQVGAASRVVDAGLVLAAILHKTRTCTGVAQPGAAETVAIRTIPIIPTVIRRALGAHADEIAAQPRVVNHGPVASRRTAPPQHPVTLTMEQKGEGESPVARTMQ